MENQPSKPENTPNPAPIEAYKGAFELHYQANYTDHDYSYEEVAPAYVYGHGLAVNETHRKKDWKALRLVAEKHWHNKGDEKFWLLFEDAVKFAWQLATGQPEALNSLETYREQVKNSTTTHPNSQVDEAIWETFPASDPPGWTKG